MSSVTREKFDYIGYMKNRGIYEEGYENNQDIKDRLYRHAAQNLNSELKKQFPKKEDRLGEVLKFLPDSRDVFGLPNENSVEQQQHLATEAGYKDYLRSKQKLIPFGDETEPDTYLTQYVNSLQDKWANPMLSQLSTDHLKSLIAPSYEDIDTANEYLEPDEPDVETVKPPAKTAWDMIKVLDVEGVAKKLVGDEVVQGLKRSWYNEDVQKYTGELIDQPNPLEMKGFRGRGVYTLPEPEGGLDPLKTENKLLGAIQKKDALGVNPLFEKIFSDGDDFSTAAGKVWDSPEVIPQVLSEGGTDMLEEGIATGLGTVAGAFVTRNPMGALASGTSALVLAVHDNVLNDTYNTELQDYYKESESPLTAERIQAFRNTPELHDAAMDKAKTVARIVAGATGTANAVGQGMFSSQVFKAMLRGGFRPSVEGGKVLLRKAPAKIIRASEFVGATAIGMAGDVGSKLAVGESTTNAELIISGASSVGSAGLSLGLGALTRKGEDKSPVDVSVGDNILNPHDGTQFIASGLSEDRNYIVSDDGVEIPIKDLGQYEISRPSTPEADPATPEVALAKPLNRDLLQDERRYALDETSLYLEPWEKTDAGSGSSLESLLGDYRMETLDDIVDGTLKSNLQTPNILAEGILKNSDAVFQADGRVRSDNPQDAQKVQTINYLNSVAKTTEFEAYRPLDSFDVEINRGNNINKTVLVNDPVHEEKIPDGSTVSDLVGRKVKINGENGVLVSDDHGEFSLTKEFETTPLPDISPTDDAIKAGFKDGLYPNNFGRLVSVTFGDDTPQIRLDELDYGYVKTQPDGRVLLVRPTGETKLVDDLQVAGRIEQKMVEHELSRLYTDRQVAEAINVLEGNTELKTPVFGSGLIEYVSDKDVAVDMDIGRVVLDGASYKYVHPELDPNGVANILSLEDFKASQVTTITDPKIIAHVQANYIEKQLQKSFSFEEVNNAIRKVESTGSVLPKDGSSGSTTATDSGTINESPDNATESEGGSGSTGSSKNSDPTSQVIAEWSKKHQGGDYPDVESFLGNTLPEFETFKADNASLSPKDLIVQFINHMEFEDPESISLVQYLTKESEGGSGSTGSPKESDPLSQIIAEWSKKHQGGAYPDVESFLENMLPDFEVFKADNSSLSPKDLIVQFINHMEFEDPESLSLVQYLTKGSTGSSKNSDPTSQIIAEWSKKHQGGDYPDVESFLGNALPEFEAFKADNSSLSPQDLIVQFINHMDFGDPESISLVQYLTKETPNKILADLKSDPRDPMVRADLKEDRKLLGEMGAKEVLSSWLNSKPKTDVTSVETLLNGKKEAFDAFKLKNPTNSEAKNLIGFLKKQRALSDDEQKFFDFISDAKTDKQKDSKSPTLLPKLKITPTTHENLRIDWGNTGGNFMPKNVLSEIERFGYAVEPTTDKQGNITSLEIDTGANQWVVKTRGVSKNKLQNADRKVVVSRKGGKPIKRFGGSKNFTIPPDNLSVRPMKDAAIFVQQIEDLRVSVGGTRTFKDDGSSNPLQINIGSKSYIFKNNPEDGNFSVQVNAGAKKFFNSPQSFSVETPLQQKKSVTAARMKALNILQDSKDKPIEPPPAINKTFKDSLGLIDSNVDLEIQNDVGVINTPAIDVHVESPTNNPSDVLRQSTIETYSHVRNDTDDGDAPDFTPWDSKSLESVLDYFPKHIKEIITLHHSEDTFPPEMATAWGFFSPNYNGNGPAIHIDARSHVRSQGDVQSTIAEEVGHFSFESVFPPHTVEKMSVFYKTAYKAYEEQIQRHLGGYIEDYNIGKNPTTYQQWILVNELFSKQGTAFENFLDNKVTKGKISRPAGLTNAEFANLRKHATAVQKSFDLDGLGNKITDESAKQLAADIIRKQTLGITQKHTSFEYRFKEGASRQVLTVRNTPAGQYRSILPDNDQVRKVRHRSEKLRDIPANSLKGKFWRFVYKDLDIFGETISGRGINRTITTESAIGVNRDREALRYEESVRLRAEAVARKYGVQGLDGDTFPDGMQQGFRRLGVKKKGHLKLAAKYDALVFALHERKLRENTDIKRLNQVQKTELLHQAKVTGFDKEQPEQLALMLNELDDYFDGLRLDWDHVRFKAYEDPDDEAFLRKALRVARGNLGKKELSFRDEYDQATAAIKRIEASPLSPKKKFKALQEQKAKQQPHLRYSSLEKSFLFKNEGSKYNPITDQTSLIIPYINKILRSNMRKAGSGKNSTMSDHSANKQRSLDIDAGENTSDWHKARFLGRITNPAEVGIHNINEMLSIKRTLRGNYNLTKQLFDTGFGTLSPDADHSEVFLGRGQTGSILKYVAIDPEVAIDIEEQLSIQNEVLNNAFTNFVANVKIAKTVKSFFGQVNNVVGMATLSLFTGDLFRLTHIAKTVPLSRQVWVKKRYDADSKFAKSDVKNLAKLAMDYNVIGSGIGAHDLEVVNKNDSYLQGIVNGLTTVLNKTHVLPENKKIFAQEIVRNGREFIKETYSFSDDAPKLLRFISNIHLTDLKWRAKLSANDFPNADTHEKAILSNAVREAADLTLRENTDMNAMPRWLKKISHNNLRVLVSNFVTHNAQVVKIHAENVRIWGEMASDLKEAKSTNTPEHKRWARQLQKNMLLRGVGNGAVYTGLGVAAVAGSSMLVDVVNAFGEADEKGEVKMTPTQMEGAQRLLQSIPSYKSGAVRFNPMVIKDGAYIHAIDGGRMDYQGGMVAPKQATRDPDYLAQLQQSLTGLVLSSQGNVTEQVSDAVKGKTWLGEDVGAGLWATNFTSIVGNLLTPQAVPELYELATDRSWYSGVRQSSLTARGKFMGMRIKRFSSDDLISDIGRNLSFELRSPPHISSVLKELQLGKVALDEKRILGYIEKDLYINEGKMAEYGYLMDGAKMFLTTEKTNEKKVNRALKKLLKKYKNKNKKTGFDKKQASLLVADKNIFNIRSVQRIESAIKAVDNRKPDRGWTKQDKANALETLEWMLEQYPS